MLIWNTRVYSHLPVRDPWFLHFLLLALTWKHNTRILSSKQIVHGASCFFRMPRSYLSRRSAKISRLWPPHGSSALLRNTFPWSRVSRTVFPACTVVLRRPAGSGLSPCSNQAVKEQWKLKLTERFIKHRLKC